MQLLVCGGAGFIGSVFIKNFLNSLNKDEDFLGRIGYNLYYEHKKSDKEELMTPLKEDFLLESLVQLCNSNHKAPQLIIFSD